MEQLNSLPKNVFAITPALLHFADKHRILIKAALENRGAGNFIDTVQAYLYGAYHVDWEHMNPQMTNNEVKFLFHYVTSGIIGIIRLWLIEMPEEHVDTIITKTDYLLRITNPASQVDSTLVGVTGFEPVTSSV
ncbi:MAG: TetR family transcriptional regulator C-terminal domain-containing protein [Coriobacteriales bacterium]|nr:TetR family transcriptional regulator C-terminal domain-containing protein [Coriobacteriales bacterium]